MGNRLFTAHVTQSPGATVARIDQGSWHLELAAHSTRTYRLAQLDDHGGLSRDKFLWNPPLAFSIEARVSSEGLPGTWGFGFWNEPFSFLIGGDRTTRRFPTLPNAAWFFHASPENYLSFRDDLPANGFLSASFSSGKLHPALLALALPTLALTLLPSTARLIRSRLRRLIKQDASTLDVDVTIWHTYTIDWQPTRVCFSLDGVELWRTTIAPSPPLCLVIWIDNQYAALPSRGRVRYGVLSNPLPAWLEVRNINLVDRLPLLSHL